MFDTPHEIAHVRMAATKTTIAWDSDAPNSGSATVYDVLRGHLDELPVGSGASETCLADGIAGTSVEDATVPAAGAGFYYVVRGSSSCGLGPYGYETGGPERSSAVCP